MDGSNVHGKKILILNGGGGQVVGEGKAVWRHLLSFRQLRGDIGPHLIGRKIIHIRL